MQSHINTLLFAISLLGAAQVPELPLGNATPLTPGYQTNVDGCVFNGHDSLPKTLLLAPNDPQVIKDFKGSPESLALYSAQYNELNHNLILAIAQLRHALHVSLATESEERKDFTIRLPLSIDLLRAGALIEAQREWKLILSRRPELNQSAAFDIFEEGNYTRGFQALRRDPPHINAQFEDSGAAAHLESGVTYATKYQYAQAVKELNLSARCSPGFELPHLLLGFILQIRNRNKEAKDEWITTLEGHEPSSPDSAGISAEQYTAMFMLLKAH